MSLDNDVSNLLDELARVLPKGGGPIDLVTSSTALAVLLGRSLAEWHTKLTCNPEEILADHVKLIRAAIALSLLERT